MSFLSPFLPNIHLKYVEAIDRSCYAEKHILHFLNLEQNLVRQFRDGFIVIMARTKPEQTYRCQVIIDCGSLSVALSSRPVGCSQLCISGSLTVKVVRPLLSLGNGKLGAAIHLWSIPAIGTCPGSTELCRRLCYANQSRFTLATVRERLDWNYDQAVRDDFVPRMVEEIRRKGAIVLRVHVAGDYFSAEYAGKWLAIMKKCPKVRYYWYTRSWRVPEIAPVLEDMAALRCCRGWYSIDAETGVPLRVPVGIRLAYLQVDEDDRPELADLTFRVRRLRKQTKKQRIGLPLVCPAETPEGKRHDTNCGSCGICWRD